MKFERRLNGFTITKPKKKTSETDEEFEFTSSNDNLDDIEHLKDMASEAPVIRIVNQIMTNAMSQRASDIHIEPL